MKKTNLVDLQAAVNNNSPVWLLVSGEATTRMPLGEVCGRLEKGFMCLPDEETRKTWDKQVEKERAAAEAAALAPMK